MSEPELTAGHLGSDELLGFMRQSMATLATGRPAARAAGRSVRLTSPQGKPHTLMTNTHLLAGRFGADQLSPKAALRIRVCWCPIASTRPRASYYAISQAATAS